MRSYLRFLPGLVCCFLFFAGGELSQAQDTKQRVEKAVLSFCEFEFNGAQDPSLRADLVQFSDARLVEIRKTTHDINPYLFEWQASPLHAIESFKITRVTVLEGEVSADVEYVIVAQRNEWSGMIRAVPKAALHSQLRLKQFDSKWKVVDPPFPFVSTTFLSTSYRGLFEMPEALTCPHFPHGDLTT